MVYTTFKRFLEEQVNLVIEETLPKASSNTKGVLHELLVGYHLNGKKHMEKHPDVNGDSPRQAHDKLKASISKEEYKSIHDKAKSAADHIKSVVGTHGDVHKVHWTSKPGDLHRSTGIHASQKEDASDIVVSTKHKKTGEVKHHGVSLKVTDKNTGHVPVSNPGMEATHGGKAILEAHRKSLLLKHPKLAGAAKSDRKEYMKKNPKAEQDIKNRNQKVLSDIVDHTHKKLSSMNTKDLADHIRHHVLHAHETPMQKHGHSHLRVTSYGNNTHHHMDPSTHHEHILKDHKNIKVEKRGTSVVFTHKGKAFARHRMKFESQSDPMSSIKGSGELM